MNRVAFIILVAALLTGCIGATNPDIKQGSVVIENTDETTYEVHVEVVDSDSVALVGKNETIRVGPDETIVISAFTSVGGEHQIRVNSSFSEAKYAQISQNYDAVKGDYYHITISNRSIDVSIKSSS